MSIVLLISLPAASEEDYAVVIYGDDADSSEYCQDCYANIVTQTDNQMIENVNIGVSQTALDAIGVGEEGLSTAITVTPQFQDQGYVIQGFALRNLLGNGIMISDTKAPIILKDIVVESQGVQTQSSASVGIGLENAMNVSIENCTALKGSLFRISKSHNIQIKNDTAKYFFLEGIKNSTIDNCTADCIMIKGSISLFYNYKPRGLANATVDDPFIGISENIIEPSVNCTIKNCNQIKEIDLFNAEDCIVESCTMKDIGLWMVNAENIIVRNASVINGTLSIDWSRDLVFENLSLINSDISMAGSVPDDFSVGFKNCTIDGMPIVYYENQSQLKLENITAGQIWLRDCPEARIDNCTAREIYVINSNGVVIENSRIDGDGINLIFSEDCRLSNNMLASEGSGA